MIDELNELRSANPHQPEQLVGAVAMEPVDVIVALRTDARRIPFAPVLPGGRWRRRPPTPSPRIRWACALAATAVAIIAFGGTATRGSGVIDVGDTPSTTPTDPAAPADTDSSDGLPTTTSGSDLPSPSSSTTLHSGAPTSSPTIPGPDAAEPTGTPPTTGDSPTTTSSPPTTVGGTEATNPPRSGEAIEGPFTAGIDLLAVHLDFAHLDDGHSALATREVTEWFALDPVVVAGTAAPGTGSFAHPYHEIMTAGWGSAWIDARTDRIEAVDLAVSQWLDVLDAGGDVWVAEGGVSDFTAEVVRTVRATRPQLETSTRIHVVQHAQRNENETRGADLTYLLANADYIRIDDGNNANDTADLNATSSEFETTALAGPRSTAWSVGFDYHPASELDFSDTVAVLHVLGVGTDRVADPTDFASLFMASD